MGNNKPRSRFVVWLVVRGDDAEPWITTLARLVREVAIDRASLREIARLKVGERWNSGSGASPWIEVERVRGL